MTAVHNSNLSAARSTIPFDVFVDPAVCLSTQLHAGVAVIVAAGELDAANIHHLTNYVRHCMTKRRASLVLDLRRLDFLAARGISALQEIDDECDRRRIDWALVPSRPVARLLQLCDTDARLPSDKGSHLPIVSSIDAALERFSRPAQAQRLLQLVTKPG